ncbi:MAG: phosphatidylglycerophosphatase A [Bacteroidetes bacterium]|nr:phosphatidylglycerophosphatase A [Bacteroidota bacterium]
MEQNPNTTERLPLTLRCIGTGFFSGYSPVAPGTAGSLTALLFLFIPKFSETTVLLPAIFIFFFLGAYAADKMEKIYGQDPGIVTIDEVVGMWISILFLPHTPLFLGTAFLIFRILDILKPYPAGEIDKKKGGWNIMLDDVIAGMYTNIILQIAFHNLSFINL